MNGTQDVLTETQRERERERLHGKVAETDFFHGTEVFRHCLSSRESGFRLHELYQGLRSAAGETFWEVWCQLGARV